MSLHSCGAEQALFDSFIELDPVLDLLCRLEVLAALNNLLLLPQARATMVEVGHPKECRRGLEFTTSRTDVSVSSMHRNSTASPS